MLHGDKKKFMTITLKFYVIVNKIYLYNYSDKIKVWQNIKNNYIKYIKVVFYIIKIKNK